MAGHKVRSRKRNLPRNSMRNNVQHNAGRLQSGIGKMNNIPADPPPIRRASPVSGTISFYLRQYEGYTTELPPISQQFGVGSFLEPGYITVTPSESGQSGHKGLNSGIIEGMIFSQLLGVNITCLRTEGFRFMIHKISVWGAILTNDVGLTIDPYLTGTKSAPSAAYDNSAKTRWPRVSWTSPMPNWLGTAPEVTQNLGTVLINMPPYVRNEEVYNLTYPADETQILVRISVTCTTSASGYTTCENPPEGSRRAWRTLHPELLKPRENCGEECQNCKEMPEAFPPGFCAKYGITKSGFRTTD